MASSNQRYNVCDRGTEQSVSNRGSADGISVAQLGGQDGQARISEAAERNEGDRESYSCHGSAEVDQTADAFDTTGTCGECGASEFDQSSSGEWYCAECGLLQSTSEIEFSEPSWTPADERRTSPASSPSRLGVGTVIGNTGGSAPRWAKYNTRLSHDKETLRHGLKEIRAVGAALEASAPIVDQAATLFRDAAEEGLLMGQSLEAMSAGCVHAAARDCHRPFPTKAVAAVSPVNDEAIRSAYSKLIREFDLRVAPPTPTAFIPRFSADAELSQDVQRRGRQLAETMIEDGSHIGQSPTGVAAAALYGAAVESGTEITQKELAEVAHVSVVTLSRQWQTIQTYLEDGL